MLTRISGTQTFSRFRRGDQKKEAPDLLVRGFIFITTLTKSTTTNEINSLKIGDNVISEGRNHSIIVNLAIGGECRQIGAG